MRALITGLAFFLVGFGAAAQQAARPAELSGLDVRAPDFEGQAMMGYNLCLDSREGLPPLEHADYLLILWPCEGGENQRLILSEGVLYVGPARLHRIEIMSPGERCDDYNVQSARRAYRLGICRSDELVVQRRIDYDAGAAFIGSDAPREVTGPLPGDPLVVRRFRDSDAPIQRWEYVRSTRQLRARGTELCITPPSQDSTGGAPLYLDHCAQPFRLSRDVRDDGWRRSQVELVPVFPDAF